MPSINFPANPVNGQKYIYNNSTWNYNGSAWILTGLNGVQGPQGIGPQGNQGSQGPTGLQRGFQGFQGPTGPQGNQGFQGPTGTQGNQGFQGLTGPQGDQGFQGPTGPQGNQGFQGPNGPQGNQGFQGPTGHQGNRGFQGPTAPSPGIQGATGPQGFTGPGPSFLVGTTFSNPSTGSVWIRTDAFVSSLVYGGIAQTVPANTGSPWFYTGTSWRPFSQYLMIHHDVQTATSSPLSIAGATNTIVQMATIQVPAGLLVNDCNIIVRYNLLFSIGATGAAYSNIQLRRAGVPSVGSGNNVTNQFGTYQFQVDKPIQIKNDTYIQFGIGDIVSSVGGLQRTFTSFTFSTITNSFNIDILAAKPNVNDSLNLTYFEVGIEYPQR